MKLVTLSEWDEKNHSKLHTLQTLRKWAVMGFIHPEPHKQGRSWMVREDAVYRKPEQTRTERIKQAAEMNDNDNSLPAAIDPKALEIFKHGSAAL